MVASFLLKKKINTLFINIEFQKKKNNPPTQPCTVIILYFNMKLLKHLNSLNTLEYP
jgi:hypothetical protein